MNATALRETIAFLEKHTHGFRPEAGLVLGTGLNGLAEALEVVASLPYDQIPHFPLATAETHRGRLVFGYLGGRPVVCMQGRFHYYEGHTMQQVGWPIRAMHGLGATALLLSNAAGGLNPAQRVADLMLLEDHISLLLPDSPLRGPHEPEWGPRWPDMSRPYDPDLLAAALAYAGQAGIRCHTGVYVSVPGPQLETPAEYRLLRLLGADAVGMSTVPEVIVARQLGMRCLAVSVITDLGLPQGPAQPVSIAAILAAAAEAEPGLTRLMQHIVQLL